MEKKEKLTEGKTKIIWRTDDPNKVIIENKSILTKGDGAVSLVLENKDVYSTETTSNCFLLLNKKGILTHFIKRFDKNSFVAFLLKMIPIEIVIRRIAFGSILKRNPTLKEGTFFEDLIVEFFLKNDPLHDPIMIWNEEKQCFELFDAKKPISSESYLGEISSKNIPLLPKNKEEVEKIFNIAKNVFLILEKAWRMLNVTLVDLKIECGYFPERRDLIVVGDVIDNDSKRIWEKGDKKLMKDKQVFRDLTEITEENKRKILENYAWVANQTKKFLTLPI